jgi:alpha-ketoglutarate-dependent taurine dioxygenase
VVWDNRCTLHLAVHDYDPSEFRHLLRISLVDADVRNPVYTPSMEAVGV